MHQAVVLSFAPPEAPWDADPISAGGALATTTMAGQSSLPFSVQTGVQACMTLPGGWAALSCSAIAWCMFGSNGAPVGSSRLMPFRSRMFRKFRSIPSRPANRGLPGPGVEAAGGPVESLFRRQAFPSKASVKRVRQLQRLEAKPDAISPGLHSPLADSAGLVVGAAAGVVLLIVHPYDTAPAGPPATGFRITPTIGVGSLGAIGTF